ncbi:hypothetical protein [Fibrobacter sp. UWT2]|uniref:hypothetical protein n=1 Tax=Fibrobacter sp. UWT2 TaxID=1896224 RepID=UPI000932569F|nr:hypothetical protein [Fibrobacter sp. UWT2]
MECDEELDSGIGGSLELDVGKGISELDDKIGGSAELDDSSRISADEAGISIEELEMSFSAVSTLGSSAVPETGEFVDSEQASIASEKIPAHAIYSF